jgi:hypothetical protein
VHKWLVDRPQVWPNWAAQVTPNKAKATATILAAVELPVDAAGKPVAHGINANNMLYAFVEANPGQFVYLGEFNVTKSEDRQIMLQPAYMLTDSDLKKLTEARGPWTFYNVLPKDNHETFESLNEEQKKALLPESSLADYEKDGKPAAPQDPKERIDAAGLYVRQLRDYTQLFNSVRKQNTVLFDETEATKRDKALVDESLADAQRQVQFAQTITTDLKKQLAKKMKEVDTVANLRKLLEEKLKSIESTVESLIEKNKAMAGQIAQLQLEATRIIDARTRAMAKAAMRGEKE